jgi:hypothetical protein
MPIPSVLVTRYFQLIVDRQFTEAERELDRIKQKMQKTEWNRGYFRALFGMFLSRKANGDVYAFFAKLDLSDKAALHDYRREFLDHVGNKLHGDFDRGYFSAWADCMRVLSRMNIPSMSNQNHAASEKGSEAVTAEGTQPTTESFLEGEEG